MRRLMMMAGALFGLVALAGQAAKADTVKIALPVASLESLTRFLESQFGNLQYGPAARRSIRA